MKTLNTLQKLSKVGKVFSKIIYICCIVGICGCAVGIVAMIVGEEVVQLGGLTLHGILADADVSVGTVWAAITVGMILCVGEFFLSRKACRYFENELKAGTPFTLGGAKEMLNLGISCIWIPIVSVIVAQIAQSIFALCMENVEKLSLDDFGSLALGVMFVVASLLCKYGAEREQSAGGAKEEL